MRSFLMNLSWVLGALMCAITTTMAQAPQSTKDRDARSKPPPARSAAEEPKTQNGIYRIELWNGPTKTVRYLFKGDVPTTEREAALDMERAENEVIYLRDQERLKKEYVNDERMQEANRNDVQRQLYGTSITTGRDLSSYGSSGYGSGYGGGLYGGGLYGGYGLYGGGLGYYPYGSGMGYPYGYGGSINRMGGYSGEAWQTVNRSLKNGVGDEGRFKEAMVQAIAKQTSPQYASEVLDHYQRARARAGEMPMLAKALSVRKAPIATADYEPSFPKDSRVVIWAGGDRYSGVVKEDHPGWVILTTDDGEMRLRKSEIVRSQVKAAPARPAATERVSHATGSNK